MGTIRFVKGDEREWINPLEKANDDNGSRTCMHQPGSDDELQLFEVKCPPSLEVEAHVHDVDEIIVVTEGSAQFGRQVYGVGSSVFIPKMTLYSFKAGPDGLTYLNFRPVKGSLAIYKDEFLTMRNQRVDFGG